VIHRYRRLWLLVAVVASLLAGPAGALAAVETDTVLTVRFVDAETLLPVDGAAVHVTASQGAIVIAEFDVTTDADGLAVVAALPRETGEGDPVVVDVTATKSTSFTDDESGCTFADSWYAERLAVAVDGAEVSVDFTADEQSPASSIQCPPEEVPPSQEVEGTVGTPAPAATLPSTDTLGDSADGASGGIAVVIAVIGIAAGMLFLAPCGRLATRRDPLRRR
jgi:hypothetical protein